MTEQYTQFELNIDVPDGAAAAAAEFTVPHGKRLLIDHIASDVRLPVGQRGCLIVHTKPSLPGAARASVPFTFGLVPSGCNISTGIGFECHYLSQVTRLFSVGSLEIILSRGPAPTTPGRASALVAVSGRLVTA
jgi:hypothetical protein